MTEAHLPAGWSNAKLGELIEFKYGKSLPKSARMGAEFPVYGSNGIVGRHEEALTEGACLIIGRKGSFGEVAISRTPAWPIDTTYYVDELHGQSIDFWYWYLQCLPLKELNRSTAVPGLNREDAYALPVKVPPPEEQARIGQKISELFESLEQLEGSLDVASGLLKKYRTSILLSATYGRSIEGWASETSKTSSLNLTEKILSDYKKRRNQALVTREAVVLTSSDVEQLPHIPEHWVWSRVGVIGDVQLGRQRSPKYHSGKNMRPYLRVANVFEDRIDTSDIMEMDFSPVEYSLYKLEPGDVLLNEGQSLDLVGRPALFRGEVNNACFTNTLIRFRASKLILPDYALIVFRYYMHSGRFQRIAKITTNLAHLGAGRFAGLEFPVPPLEEQEQIVQKFARQFAASERLDALLSRANDNSRRLKRSILLKAFRGELVDQNFSDEPASGLINRIARERHAARDRRKSRTSKAVPGKFTMKNFLPIRDALKDHGRALSAQELFQLSGYPDDAPTDLVERFFLDLREGLSSGLLVRTSDGHEDVFSLKEIID